MDRFSGFSGAFPSLSGRRAAIASLAVGDLDLPSRVAWVRGKSRQGEREPVDLSEPAVAALRAYLEARGPLASDAPAFASADRARKGSGGLTADGIHSLLQALSRRAGIQHALAPHDLRRLGARSLAKAGADVNSRPKCTTHIRGIVHHPRGPEGPDPLATL